MNKTAFLFTGQGAQYVGMGKELYENSPEFKDIFDYACEHIKIDLRNICFHGDLSELSRTKNLQPAIVAISYGIYKLLEKDNIVPVAAAGFSLGEMSALASLGILKFSDVLTLVRIRGDIMEAACEHTKGAMCSIIGLDDAAVEEICANTDGYVIPANYNCPGQLVISGEADSVERAAAACAEKGARTVKLNVSGAFHSKLMEYRESGEDKDSLSEILQSFEFSPPSIDFYLNISGEKIPDTVKENALNLRAFMVDYIVRQMSSPVKFRATLENMERDGVDNFIEIGVGKVLSGFVRRTCKTAKFSNFEYHK